MPLVARVLWKTPGPQPNGLQATEDGLWVMDQADNQIYLLDYNGNTLQIWPTRANHSSGITLDDRGGIWVASTFTYEIICYDRESGKERAAFPTPPGDRSGGPHGMEYRDGALWFNVPVTNQIFRVDPGSGEITHSIPGHGNRLHGMAWEGDALWCVDTNKRVVFKLNPEDGDILDAVGVSQPEPHGMTRWQDQFWFCDANTREVFVLDQK